MRRRRSLSSGLRRGARAEGRNRVAKCLHQQKQDHADDEQLGNGLPKPAQDVVGHKPVGLKFSSGPYGPDVTILQQD
jgi:hypothetical protein